MPYLAQVSIQYDSGLPEDVAVNTFHFHDRGTPSLNVNAVVAALHDFYDKPPAGGADPVRFWLSSLLNPDTWRVKIYDLSDPKPRVPLDDVVFPLTNVGASSAPEEVAICLSFQAEPASGINQARRRNRIYFGPLAANAYAPSGARMAPAPDAIASLGEAAVDLAALSAAALDWQWVVYSPKSGQFDAIDHAWIDNALDTQRRRGPKPTARTTFSFGVGS